MNFTDALWPVDESGRIRPGLHCHQCKYDLRGQPDQGRCPECGEQITVSSKRYATQGSMRQRIRFSLGLLFAGLFCFAFGAGVWSVSSGETSFMYMRMAYRFGLADRILYLLVSLGYPLMATCLLVAALLFWRRRGWPWRIASLLALFLPIGYMLLLAWYIDFNLPRGPHYAVLFQCLLYPSLIPAMGIVLRDCRALHRRIVRTRLGWRMTGVWRLLFAWLALWLIWILVHAMDWSVGLNLYLGYRNKIWATLIFGFFEYTGIIVAFGVPGLMLVIAVRMQLLGKREPFLFTPRYLRATNPHAPPRNVTST